MAASLPTDIIMDVVRAADPERVQAARDRLAAFAGQSISPNEFATRLDAAATRSTSSVNAEPFQQFEAFVLQSFIENMLPDDTDSVYGGGLAGGYWKSMMAEQLAGQMAKAGGIGIADRILADHFARVGQEPPSGEDALSLDRRDAEARNLTSQAIVHEIQRRIGGGLGNSSGLLTDRNEG